MLIEITCPVCNFSKRVPKEKIPEGTTYTKCPRCEESFEFDPLNYVSDLKEENTGRSDLHMSQGFFKTFKSVLFSPKGFFDKMGQAEGFREPLAFGMLFGSISNMVAIFWQFLLMHAKILALGDGYLNQGSLYLLFIGVLVLCPALVILNMFITGGIIHLLLIILRADKGGFNGTFRVIAYSQAAKVLAFIPYLGVPAGWLWNIIIVIIGLRKVHDTSYSKIVLVILSALVFQLLILLLLVFIISMILGSFIL